MIVKNCFPGGLRKAVTFSFDDGVRQDLRLMESFGNTESKPHLI